MRKIDRQYTFGMKVDEKELQMLEELSAKSGMTKSAFVWYIIQQLAVNGMATVNGWKGAK